MENKILTFIWCLFTIMIVNGCSNLLGKDEEEDEDVTKDYLFSVSPLSLNSMPEGDVLTISVTSDTIWTAECNIDWCKLSNNSGRGDMEVKVTTEPNNTGMQRQGTILFRALKKTAEVTITQDANDEETEQKLPMTFYPQGLDVKTQGIGLFVVNHTDGGDGSLTDFSGNQVNNEEIIWNGTEWAFRNEVWWKDPDTMTSAYAYVPFREIGYDDIPEAWGISLMGDQTSYENFEASCSYYGCARNVYPGNDNMLQIEMRPLNGCFSLEINYDKEDYKLLSVKLKGVYRNAKLNLNDGSLSNNTSEGEVMAYIDGEEGQKKASFILLPQMLSEGNVFEIEMKDLSKDENSPSVIYNLTPGNDMEIISGNKYSTSCQIKSSLQELVIDGVTVKDWEPGDDFIFSFD